MNISSIENSDYDPFSKKSLETVEIVESFPYSTAFEHLMYDTRIQRRVSHVMHESLVLDLVQRGPVSVGETMSRNILPKALQGMFPSNSYEIRNLVVQFDEYTDPLSSSLSMSFETNGKIHVVESGGSTAHYSTENEYGESVSYKFESADAVGLLATMVYARQFDPEVKPDEDSSRHINLVENQLDAPRDAENALTEQLIMTLGHLDGESSVETTALFEVGDNAIVARLRETEHPELSSIVNTIDLTELSLLKNTNLHQDGVNFKSEPGAQEHRFARIYDRDANKTTVHRSDHAKWAVICHRFYASIAPKLAKYAYLDDV